MDRNGTLFVGLCHSVPKYIVICANLSHGYGDTPQWCKSVTNSVLRNSLTLTLSLLVSEEGLSDTKKRSALLEIKRNRIGVVSGNADLGVVLRPFFYTWPVFHDISEGQQDRWASKHDTKGTNWPQN